MTIEKRVSDAERLNRIQSGLHCTAEEAKEILAYDKAVDRGETTEFDLAPDKAKVAQKFAHAGTRKAPTVYKFTQRKRQPNATKGGLIAEIAEFLRENSQFSVENLEIPNKERQISFSVGGEKFEFTLVQKRKPKA